MGQRKGEIVTGRSIRWLQVLSDEDETSLTADEAGGPAATTAAQLRELVARGFRFVHPTDAEGELAAVVGVRVHDSVVDIVKLRAENDVHATRIPGSEVDILSPSRLLWQSSGFVGDVLAELLDLPDEPDSCENTRANGCWLPIRPGTAKWLPTSA